MIGITVGVKSEPTSGEREALLLLHVSLETKGLPVVVRECCKRGCASNRRQYRTRDTGD